MRPFGTSAFFPSKHMLSWTPLYDLFAGIHNYNKSGMS